MTRDPSLPLQDAIYLALKDLANGQVVYDVPDGLPLPYIYFGDDEISADYDSGGDFYDVTANVEVYALDKITLKELVGQIVGRLDSQITIEGFDVLEWRVGYSNYRTMEDGQTRQASLEFNYLLAPAS
jgi:hypothetical protein